MTKYQKYLCPLLPFEIFYLQSRTAQQISIIQPFHYRHLLYQPSCCLLHYKHLNYLIGLLKYIAFQLKLPK